MVIYMHASSHNILKFANSSVAIRVQADISEHPKNLLANILVTMLPEHTNLSFKACSQGNKTEGKILYE